MPIGIVCSCGQKLSAKESLAGKRLKCPKCQAPVVVPASNAPHSEPRTTVVPGSVAEQIGCPHCGAKFALADESQMGHQISCLKCKTAFVVGEECSSPSVNDDLLAGLSAEDMVAAPQSPAAPSCPSCGGLLQQNAVLCVSCGLNLKSKKQLRTSVASVSGTRVSVERGADGQMAIKTAWTSHKPSDFSSVWFVQRATDYQPLMLLVLIGLFCAGFIPGLIFWYLYFTAQRVGYAVELRGAGKRKVVFRGNEESKGQAQALAKMISQSTGLVYETQLDMFD